MFFNAKVDTVGEVTININCIQYAGKMLNGNTYLRLKDGCTLNIDMNYYQFNKMLYVLKIKY